MVESGGTSNRERNNDQVPEIFRVRRDQAVSAVALPVVITIIGVLIAFGHNFYTDRDQRIQIVRKDIQHYIDREIDRLEERQNKQFDRIERRIVWIEQVVSKSEK